MSTRARIGILNADKTITSIYTHSDGYVSHHGPILLGHYNSEAKVRALLALGDLSCLAENLGEKHDFNSRADGWCRSYRRDRGETGTEARKIKHVGLFVNRANECGAEYIYLFRDGVWYVAGVSRTTRTPEWEVLTTAVAKERLTT